jgi:hypothetical protein
MHLFGPAVPLRVDPADAWPMPEFNAGEHYHVHALGVISLNVAQFERSIDNLYNFYPRKLSLPDELASLYYFSLNEERRLIAIKAIFDRYEEDNLIKELIENLLRHFQWCRNTRNQLLHAELYPAGFGKKPGLLYLTKRLGKQSPVSGYMKFSLDSLREIATQARAGIVQSAELHIYLRVRGEPIEKIEPSLQPYADRESLPKPLPIPKPLEIDENP